MEPATFAVEAEQEATHWWFVGRRRLFGRELAALGLSLQARVLDLGTSTGSNLRMLRDLGFTQVVGLDSSPEAAAYCQAKGLGEVHIGDALALPFADQSFELVLATDVIEHIERDDLALQEIERVLQPGGVVLLTVPTFPSLWGLQDQVAHHKRRYYLAQLLERAGLAGLQVERSYYFNFLLFLPIWLARQVIRLRQLPLQSENQVNTPWLNRVLLALFLLDVRLAPYLRAPFGVSALALARKPGGPAQKSGMAAHTLAEKTIGDFGDQWTRYTDNDGFYGSTQLLQDALGPLLDLSELRQQKVAEIGSGTGRIIGALLQVGVAKALAIEPSQAFGPLQQYLQSYGDRVECWQIRGQDLPPGLELDTIFSIGVIHHIPDPLPVLRAARAALKPGGRCLIWLYGYEGNQLYLSLVLPLRRLSTRLPHRALAGLSHLLNLALALYILLCRLLPLPLSGYMRNVIGKFSWQKRFLVIYDQLNPAYSKYYRRQEAQDLMEAAGFSQVQLYHRHGYSWTVIGTNDQGSLE